MNLQETARDRESVSNAASNSPEKSSKNNQASRASDMAAAGAATLQFVNQARDALGQSAGSGSAVENNSLLKNAPPDVKPLIKETLDSLVQNEAKGASRAQDIPALRKLVENTPFQNFASKKIGLQKLNEFNQATAGAVLSNRPRVKAAELLRIKSVYEVATGQLTGSFDAVNSENTGTNMVSNAPFKFDKADSGISSASPASSAKNILKNFMSTGESLPANVLEWVDIAKWLGSKKGSLELPTGMELRRYLLGLSQLDDWIAELRKFKMLGLLSLLREPFNPDDMREKIEDSLLVALKSLRHTAQLKDSPTVAGREILKLRLFVDQTLQDLIKATTRKEQLFILVGAFKDATMRAYWRKYDKESYLEVRAIVGLMIFHDRAPALPPEADLKNQAPLQSVVSIAQAWLRDVNKKVTENKKAVAVPTGDDSY